MTIGPGDSYRRKAEEQIERERIEREYMLAQLRATRNNYGDPYKGLGWLDPQLAQNVVAPGERDWDGKRKPLPRRADEYKRKGG
jgi:hypothetical protein